MVSFFFSFCYRYLWFNSGMCHAVEIVVCTPGNYGGGRTLCITSRWGFCFTNSESFISTHSTLIEPFLCALYYILPILVFLPIITWKKPKTACSSAWVQMPFLFLHNEAGVSHNQASQKYINEQSVKTNNAVSNGKMFTQSTTHTGQSNNESWPALVPMQVLPVCYTQRWTAVVISWNGTEHLGKHRTVL